MRIGCGLDEQKLDDVRQRFWTVTVFNARWQHCNVARLHRYGRVGEPLVPGIAIRRGARFSPETQRRDPCHPAKLIGEVGLTAEAHRERNVRERLIGVSQQFLRPLDPAGRHELVRGTPVEVLNARAK